MASLSTLLIAASMELAAVIFFTSLGAIALTGGRLLFRYLDRFDTLAIRPEDAPMLYELGVSDGFLVSMWVLQGYAVTGQDRGAMWIEGDRLLFSGRSMSFALTREAITGGLRRPRLSPGEMELVLEDSDLAVSFTPLFGDRPYTWVPSWLVARWLDEAGPSWEASQVPPAGLGPGADTPKAVRASIASRILREVGFVGVLFFPIALYGGYLPLLAGVLAAGAVVGFWWPLRKRRLALRDCRRLAERT
ncbi:hypothetical protein EON82_13830 [bacterium]|nr:MAG: hypothetical protein EON82_13830 [bacterium]